jgi:WD40 repeat protein
MMFIIADAWTVSFSPDGKNIASGSYTGKVNVFNLETGRKETNFQLDSKGKFTMSISYVLILLNFFFLFKNLKC